MEQPEAIARALSYGARMNGRRIVLGGMDKNVDILSQVGRVRVTRAVFGEGNHFGADVCMV
jgi:hypothetical protein